MLIFPCLSTGAIAQYPIRQTVSCRTVKSVLEDGTQICKSDDGARFLKWIMPFRGLSDAEAKSLTDLHAATKGSLLPFLFLDPTVNLLRSSDDLTTTAWTSSGISIERGVVDPFGGTGAFRLHNYTPSETSLVQATPIPGLAQTCFSVYIRSTAQSITSLGRTAGAALRTTRVTAQPKWQRISLSSVLPGVESGCSFSVGTAPGTSIEIYGPQVDAQIAPSPYSPSDAWGGIHENAHFDSDQIQIRMIGPNRNDCVVSVRCNVPAGGKQ